MIWDALDALAEKEGAHGRGPAHGGDGRPQRGGLGAHMQDRNDERIAWALEAMRAELGRELEVEMRGGRRRGLHRPR